MILLSILKSVALDLHLFSMQPEMKREVILSKQYEFLHAKLCHTLEGKDLA